MEWRFSKYFGKGKFFGITKLDLQIYDHLRRHGKFRDPEILAHCPICDQDHKVLYFICKCGDHFICHLNNQENEFKVGKWTTDTPIFE